MGSVATIGMGFPRAMSLLGPHCYETRIGELSMEVLSLTQIPREGLVRQKFLLLSCHRRGLLRWRESFAQSVLHCTEGMEREKDVLLCSHLS